MGAPPSELWAFLRPGVLQPPVPPAALMGSSSGPCVFPKIRVQWRQGVRGSLWCRGTLVLAPARVRAGDDGHSERS